MGLKIYSSTLDLSDINAPSFGEVLHDVPKDRVCGVVVYGTSSVVNYHTLLDTIKSEIYGVLKRRVPVTLVPQYLLPSGGFSFQIYTLDSAATVRIEESEGICYGVIEGSDSSMLFVEGIPSSDFSESVALQSREVFAKLNTLLSTYGFAVDDIVRQWNYIGNIVSCRDGKQNYQEFNDARTAYYSRGEWGNGYPAATGIGTSSESIIVGCIAFKKTDATKAIYPIDNPLQVAAHIYSERVLIDTAVDAVKSTPKFERAKLIETSQGACCFVSGTAAIRGEESVEASSARLQTIKTIENIEYLVSKANLMRYGCKPYDLEYVNHIVYIKNAEDYEEVRAVVEAKYPNVNTIYTIADVCRSELVVEIESILITK